MQIEWINTFLDLVESRSFNRTADRLGVTQSTVSGRVQALEAALGTKLFVRSRSGTELSAEGVRFEPHARLIRQDWTQGLRAVRAGNRIDAALRIGVQNDLAQAFLGDLAADLRAALPRAALYLEPDYSTQMCADLVSGYLDFAVLFTPKPHPDLRFTDVGALTYILVSSETDTLSDVRPENYVLANFSPAFEAEHRQVLPDLSNAQLSAGQSMACVALLSRMGGAGYVMAPEARRLCENGRFHTVTDAPKIRQPVYLATHLRNRTGALHRRLVETVQAQLDA